MMRNFLILVGLTLLIIPIFVLAESSVNLNSVGVSEDGQLSVDFAYNDITKKNIVRADLLVDGRRFYVWHKRSEWKDTGEDIRVTNNWDFSNTTLTMNDNRGYPKGDYSLNVIYKKDYSVTLSEIETEKLSFSPPDQYVRSSSFASNTAVPLDQKINELYSNIVTYVAGPLAILFLVYAGYLYITSAGNPEQIGMAKEMIVSTIIAIIILLLAGLILQTIGETPVPDGNLEDNNGQEEQQLDSAEQDSENGSEEESESELEDESSSEEEPTDSGGTAEFIDADEEEGSNGINLDRADSDRELNDN